MLARQRCQEIGILVIKIQPDDMNGLAAPYAGQLSAVNQCHPVPCSRLSRRLQAVDRIVVSQGQVGNALLCRALNQLLGSQRAIRRGAVAMQVDAWILVLGYSHGHSCHKTWPQCISLGRSEEHTSELQSRPHLVCRLLLEKKK